MGRYKILHTGENILLNIDGVLRKVGFRAWRLIKAENAIEAENIAIIRMHQELNNYPALVKDTSDHPNVTVSQVEQLSFFNFVGRKSFEGFDFFFEDEE